MRKKNALPDSFLEKKLFEDYKKDTTDFSAFNAIYRAYMPLIDQYVNNRFLHNHNHRLIQPIRSNAREALRNAIKSFTPGYDSFALYAGRRIANSLHITQSNNRAGRHRRLALYLKETRNKYGSLSLFFDLSEFSLEEITETISLLSDLYTSIGGDVLEIKKMDVLELIGEPQNVSL